MYPSNSIEKYFDVIVVIIVAASDCSAIRSAEGRQQILLHYVNTCVSLSEVAQVFLWRDWDTRLVRLVRACEVTMGDTKCNGILEISVIIFWFVVIIVET